MFGNVFFYNLQFQLHKSAMTSSTDRHVADRINSNKMLGSHELTGRSETDTLALDVSHISVKNNNSSRDRMLSAPPAQ
jgi:hypothetical protein